MFPKEVVFGMSPTSRLWTTYIHFGSDCLKPGSLRRADRFWGTVAVSVPHYLLRAVDIDLEALLPTMCQDISLSTVFDDHLHERICSCILLIFLFSEERLGHEQ